MSVTGQPRRATLPPVPEPYPNWRPVRAVFLDRDGVINENRVDHVKSWDEFHFLPGAPEAVARLACAGLKVFVVTNQAVVNRGIVTYEMIHAINARMIRELEKRGGRIDAVAFCPHRPDERCGCRKPEPGLLIGLARRHGLQLHDCVIIGDALNDVEAGIAAGCRAILVLTGRGMDQLALAQKSGCTGFDIATDLGAAVERIVNRAVLFGPHQCTLTQPS